MIKDYDFISDELNQAIQLVYKLEGIDKKYFFEQCNDKEDGYYTPTISEGIDECWPELNPFLTKHFSGEGQQDALAYEWWEERCDAVKQPIFTDSSHKFWSDNSELDFNKIDEHYAEIMEVLEECYLIFQINFTELSNVVACQILSHCLSYIDDLARDTLDIEHERVWVDFMLNPNPDDIRLLKQCMHIMQMQLDGKPDNEIEQYTKLARA